MQKLDIKFEQYESERLYPIGYKFTYKPGKAPAKEYTIVNYSLTYNLNGKLQNFAYVCNYDFCGQVMSSNLPQLSIDRATNNGWERL